ncbi:hypothetical protein UFOVP315_18 [uncultured Caudovirales phage]|uniref:Uncharacterized protein n=1 Tax=uncultured Caudovirales phage TaxID=2100421 RepID=A0A6J5LV94_9CAUD|nr:hypothetical protein UFOVP315_18 [uncultured Caudovirales phage]
MTRRQHWRDIQSPVLEPEEVAWRLFNSAKSKAASRRLNFDLKFNDVLRRVRKGRCELSGIPFDHRAKPLKGVDLPFRASLDRTDNTEGYLPGNIRVVCCIYNRAKMMWAHEDVLHLAKALVARDEAACADLLERYINHNQGEFPL